MIEMTNKMLNVIMFANVESGRPGCTDAVYVQVVSRTSTNSGEFDDDDEDKDRDDDRDSHCTAYWDDDVVGDDVVRDDRDNCCSECRENDIFSHKRDDNSS